MVTPGVGYVLNAPLLQKNRGTWMNNKQVKKVQVTRQYKARSSQRNRYNDRYDPYGYHWHSGYYGAGMSGAGMYGAGMYGAGGYGGYGGYGYGRYDPYRNGRDHDSDRRGGHDSWSDDSDDDENTGTGGDTGGGGYDDCEADDAEQ
jgi:hypothetical protein